MITSKQITNVSLFAAEAVFFLIRNLDRGDVLCIDVFFSFFYNDFLIYAVWPFFNLLIRSVHLAIAHLFLFTRFYLLSSHIKVFDVSFDRHCRLFLSRVFEESEYGEKEGKFNKLKLITKLRCVNRANNRHIHLRVCSSLGHK